MSLKNIIIFIPSIEGYGVEKNLFLISNFLSKKIKNVTIISVTKKFKLEFNKSIKFVSPKNLFWQNGGRLRKYLICSFLLIKFLMTNNNNLILSFQGNLIAILISKIFKSKILIRLNSAPSGWSNNILKKNIFKIFLQFADEIIVNSKKFKKIVDEEFKVNSVNIYNPLNINIIKLKSKIFSKKIFNYQKSIKIINVGRLVDQKNQIILLKAIKELIYKKKLLIECILVGDGNLKKSYQNFILENKLNRNIKIFNFKKNPFNLIKQADLLVLSSKFEGLPNVLLEALVLNKFVISSDCPTGPREILLNGNGGLLFKSNDHKDLKNKILYFVNNKNKCKKMLKYAKKELYRFDYFNNLNKYLNLITKY
jgi:glycosyltransferase involved in cell wall biosynthesis